jgi:hypothetical protein
MSSTENNADNHPVTTTKAEKDPIVKKKYHDNLRELADRRQSDRVKDQKMIQFRSNGIKLIEDMKKLGMSYKDIQSEWGTPLSKLKEAGFSCEELKDGFSAEELKGVGFSRKQLQETFFGGVKTAKEAIEARTSFPASDIIFAYNLRKGHQFVYGDPSNKVGQVVFAEGKVGVIIGNYGGSSIHCKISYSDGSRNKDIYKGYLRFSTDTKNFFEPVHSMVPERTLAELKDEDGYTVKRLIDEWKDYSFPDSDIIAAYNLKKGHQFVEDDPSRKVGQVVFAEGKVGVITDTNKAFGWGTYCKISYSDGSRNKDMVSGYLRFAPGQAVTSEPVSAMVPNSTFAQLKDEDGYTASDMAALFEYPITDIITAYDLKKGHQFVKDDPSNRRGQVVVAEGKVGVITDTNMGTYCKIWYSDGSKSSIMSEENPYLRFAAIEVSSKGGNLIVVPVWAME